MEKMNLEDKKFENILAKEFKFKEEKVTFKELYRKLMEEKSPFTSLYYSSLFSSPDLYTLIDEYNTQNIFYFAKKIYKLKIKNSEGKVETNEILSSYEIIDIVNKKGADNIYFEDEKFSPGCNYFFFANKLNEIELYFDKDAFIKLPYFTKNFLVNSKVNIEPISLTANYSMYFNDEPNKPIDFYLTEERQKLLYRFRICFYEKNKIFKFTGPSGIGKSFFLLYYSRAFSNIIYLNVAAMKYLENNKKYNKLRNLLTEEFKRVNFENKEVDDFNKMIIDLSPFCVKKILISSINFCEKTNKSIIIILDQFKNEFNINEVNLENVSIIICSSINDKRVRTSCISYIKTRLNKGKIDYNFYFYIQKFFEFPKQTNILLSYLGNMPKYIKKFKNCKTSDEYNNKIKEIKKKIKDKLKAFYEGENFYENIIKVKQNLDLFISVYDFENIIKLYPL